MFNWFNKNKNKQQETTQVTKTKEKEKKDRYFDVIVGYNDLKEILEREIDSEFNNHVLLVGAPGTAKTLFMLEMEKKIKNAHFFDGTGISGKGLIDFLNERRNTKFICIDEIDKLNKKEQASLYNLMETGRVIYQTNKCKYDFVMKGIKIFATSNSIDKLAKPLRSRFHMFKLPEYSYEEFEQIGIRLLGREYKMPEATCRMVVDAIWNKMNSRDVRDLFKVGKITKKNDTPESLERMIDITLKYAVEGDSEFN